MTDINLVNPTSNQILIYNEITGSFDNADLTPDLIKDFTYVKGAISIGTVGSAAVYNDTISSTLRFRGIRGDGGISAINVGSDIVIQFNGDATTLSGIGRDGFLQKSNHLNDVDPVQARSNLNLMSANEAFDSFLEANASNVPDVDNKYDMGSNGRRFANMFAVNFHGHASSSSLANKLAKNGATEGQMLVWREDENDWVPENTNANKLSGLDDVDTRNLQHESVLVFNAVRNVWEVVPSSFFGGGDGGGGTGVSMTATNTGSGMGVYSTTLGNAFQFRTLKAGSNVNLNLNFDGTEITIGAVVPQNTGELLEGSNLYYTKQRMVDDLTTLSIQDLGKTDKTTSPTSGQAPVWDGSEWKWVSVNSGINTTDNLQEGITNLYFSQARANQSIVSYIDNTGILLNNLKNVNTTPANNDFLYFNSSTGNWQSKKASISELSGITLSGIQNGGVLVWDGASDSLVPGSMPTRLEDLESTTNSLAFNQASFNTFFQQKTTADIQESDSYKFLTQQNLNTMLGSSSIGALSDVNINGITNGNILIWNGNSFAPASSESLNVTVSVKVRDLTDVDTAAVDNITNGQVLAYDSVTALFKPVTLSNSMFGLTDVQGSGIAAGMGLVWNGTAFVPRTLITTNATFNNNDVVVYDSASSSFINKPITSFTPDIMNLSGVEYTSISQGHVLVYNEGISKFENKLLNLGLLSDVADLPTAGSALVYDGTTGEHIYKAYQLTDLNDVSVSGISNKDTIVYNNVTGKFENTPFMLRQLADVSGTPTNGSILTYNSVTGSHTYSQLDVSVLDGFDIVDPEVGQILVYNGSNFANTIMSLDALSDFSVGNAVNGDILVYDELSESFVNRQNSLQSLSDVSNATAILTNQAPVWDGTEYIHKHVITYDNATIEQKQIPIYNGAVIEYKTVPDILGIDEDTKQDGYVLTYQAIDDTLVFKPAPTGGGTGGVSNGGVYNFIATALQTTFTLPHDGIVMVFANGILLPNNQVDVSDTSKIVLSTPRNEFDEIRVMVVTNISNTTPSGTALNGDVYEFTATASQTTFTVSHNGGPIMVFANGVLLFSNNYTTPTNTSVVLNNARNAGDTVTILVMQ